MELVDTNGDGLLNETDFVRQLMPVSNACGPRSGPLLSNLHTC